MLPFKCSCCHLLNPRILNRCSFIPEIDTVNITFDQASFTCEEGTECTVTGRLDNLVGEIQADILMPVIIDTSMDPLTGRSLIHFRVTEYDVPVLSLQIILTSL